MAELPKVVLDPRTEAELVEQAIRTIYAVSDQQMNDFSPHSPLRALLEGQSFVLAELLWYLNKTSEAVAVEFLKNAGVERNLGTNAEVTIRFQLTIAQDVPFTVPQGFIVSDATGTLLFSTDNILVIQAGLTVGFISATATYPGSDYNLGPYEINSFQTPLAYLASVANLDVAQGGSDPETVEETIARGLDALKYRRVLITAEDYARKTQEILGDGSRAFTIPLLAEDKVTEELGTVHVFALNANGSQPVDFQIESVRNQLQVLSLIGTKTLLSPLEFQPIDVDVTCYYASGLDPSVVAENLWTALQGYLDPTVYEPGKSVYLNEIEYVLRSQTGVDRVENATINGDTVNIEMPNVFTVANARSLVVDLVSVSNITYTYVFGEGNPD